MNDLRKIITAGLAAVVMTASLAGCAGKSDKEKATDALNGTATAKDYAKAWAAYEAVEKSTWAKAHEMVKVHDECMVAWEPLWGTSPDYSAGYEGMACLKVGGPGGIETSGKDDVSNLDGKEIARKIHSLNENRVWLQNKSKEIDAVVIPAKQELAAVKAELQAKGLPTEVPQQE